MNPADQKVSPTPNRVNKYRQRFKTRDERFFEKLDKSSGSCWIYTGRKDKDGYGKFFQAGKQAPAHRVSWMIHKGAIPIGFFVLHNCPNGDNPSCVNPDHLFLGTNGDNMRDKIKKGRGNMPSGDDHHTRINRHLVPRGENHWTHKNPEKVSRGKGSKTKKVSASNRTYDKLNPRAFLHFEL